MLAKIADACLLAGCTAGGIFILSCLDKLHMPYLSDYGLEDIKFYCPPMAAIAINLFKESTLPGINNTFIGVIIGCVICVLTVDIGPLFLGNDTMMLRTASAGISIFTMKMVGHVSPPGASLAVLFIDNKAFQSGLGRFYVFTPGVTGTLALYVLALIKVEVQSMLGSSAKVKAS
mmetsp:Transcript_69110/g.114514  ORF Transcript_69110/g.114514 Transcript_69110/m.114514 type:complete len:175 (-) Transcript_69110:91-615(-)